MVYPLTLGINYYYIFVGVTVHLHIKRFNLHEFCAKMLQDSGIHDSGTWSHIGHFESCMMPDFVVPARVITSIKFSIRKSEGCGDPATVIHCRSNKGFQIENESVREIWHFLFPNDRANKLQFIQTHSVFKPVVRLRSTY